ncbi:MAG TPA: D-aminoacylase [Porticoccaceae bacterium]|jgi:N-acyl-D-aspartate/D-glutamate deacylase|nr:D-aminoacylase [Gammaproteobacteria bacterium]HIL60146.1 D-aminoacylase [Porticoccaceae bacterium]
MDTQFDLIIRNGTIVDGTGSEPYLGDIAIKNGVITDAGKVEGTAHEEIDALGLLVTPGFVDIHTHYDGQVTWGEELTPSSIHGVTTAVMGNCGVGFAPCRPGDKGRLISLMEGVEDIPHPVLEEGLPWNWESFPEYMDSLSEKKYDIDFAAQVPHGPLRVYVMGERGANREPATENDIAQMATITKEAIEVGALGFSTSRTLNHRTAEGEPTPTLTAEIKEMVGIARAVGESKAGVMQVVSDFKENESEFRILREMAKESGRPLSVSVAQHHRSPVGWRKILENISAANEDGIEIKAQVCGRPVGVLFGLELSNNPFSTHPSYQAIEHLSFEEKLERLRDPSFQKQLLSEEPILDTNPFMRQVFKRFNDLFIMGDKPDYEPKPESSVAEIAKTRGIDPMELCLDVMTAGDGKAMIYYTFLNYADYSLDPSLEMMLHPDTVLGLGDGGAHCGTICDGSFTTHMLTHWVRDRSRGERLPLPWVIKAHCQDTAKAVGLLDRGVLAQGYKADINIIDFDAMELHRPEVHYDLPAGGRRLMQFADGYVATIVSGEVVYQDGQSTGARPGRLVRGNQPSPAKFFGSIVA